MPKLFTLAEAQSLVPELERLIRQAVDYKTQYAETAAALGTFTERIMMMGGMLVDRAQAQELRGRRDTAAGRLRGVLEEIQGLGCVVKDLDIGLVDFPTEFRGKDVYLCWKLGEPAIGFWHGVDEGFRGRKAIDRDFLDNHRGDPTQ
jgi:hypothetical protein